MPLRKKAYAVLKKYKFKGVTGMKREGDVLEKSCEVMYETKVLT